MNAIPKQITVSIALSSRFTVEALDELYEGIRTACNFYEVDLVGGDTSSSNIGLFINVTAIGQADAEEIEKVLAQRKIVNPEPDLNSDVINQLKAKIKNS